MWIVLDPELDVTVQSGFDDSGPAVDWITAQILNEVDVTRLAILQRCVVAPFDPERLT